MCVFRGSQVPLKTGLAEALLSCGLWAIAFWSGMSGGRALRCECMKEGGGHVISWGSADRYQQVPSPEQAVLGTAGAGSEPGASQMQGRAEGMSADSRASVLGGEQRVSRALLVLQHKDCILI